MRPILVSFVVSWSTYKSHWSNLIILVFFFEYFSKLLTFQRFILRLIKFKVKPSGSIHKIKEILPNLAITFYRFFGWFIEMKMESGHPKTKGCISIPGISSNRSCWCLLPFGFWLPIITGFTLGNLDLFRRYRTVKRCANPFKMVTVEWEVLKEQKCRQGW